MDANKNLNAVGYCGLICKLCKGCVSCREKEQGVAVDDIECFHKKCAIKKNLNGCWECNEFPCKGDMFKGTRNRAFARFIKDEGIDTILECLEENQKNGIEYGYQKDYDRVATEEEVIELINKGRRS